MCSGLAPEVPHLNNCPYVYLGQRNSRSSLHRRSFSCRLEIYLATRLDVYRRVRYQITAAKTTRNRVSEACCLPFRVRRSDSVRRVTCCARVAVAAEIALVGFVGAKI